MTPDAPLWEWAYDAISERLDAMLEHLDGVRRGEDIEAVHDMRVGSRRLVAAMRVFAGCFPEREYRALLREARRITRLLGAVRDLDVLIEHYEEELAGAEGARRLGIGYLLALRQRERERARKPMLRGLRRLERGRFADRLRDYLRQEADKYRVGLVPIPLHEPDAGGSEPFRQAAPRLLEERLNTLYGFEQYTGNAEAVEELHEMRIAAKWLRYTMELFAPAYADELKKSIGTAKKLQELLGDLHDSDVRLDLLRATLGARLKVKGLEAVGQLSPDPVQTGLTAELRREEGTRQGCYRAFYKEWRRLESRDFRQSCGKRIAAPDAPATT